MKSTLETVAFFKSMRETLEKMSDKDAGALMKALFAHDDGEKPDLSKKSPLVQITFPIMAEALDRLTAKRMAKVRKPTANEPQTDRKPTANASHHNHSHNHDQKIISAPVKKNSFFDFDQRTGDDLDAMVRREIK